LSSLIET